MLLKCAGTGSKGNSYALVAESGEILLIECGVKWLETIKMIDYQTSKIVGCICSHAHSDHLRSYKDCLHYGIPIYTNDETAEHFEIISGEKMIGLPERIPKRIGSWIIVPFYLPHTTIDKETGALIPCPNFGYIIQNEEMGTMIYATDMQAIAVSNGEGCLCDKYGNSYVWDMDRFQFIYEETNGLPCGLPNFLTFKNMHINHMLIECNYVFKERVHIDKNKIRHVIRGHHSLENCVGFIKRNKTPDLRNVILCHLSSENADPETMQKEVQSVAGKWVNVEIAEKGFQCELSKYPF